jgi:hypothetical protein
MATLVTPITPKALGSTPRGIYIGRLTRLKRHGFVDGEPAPQQLKKPEDKRKRRIIALKPRLPILALNCV